MTTVADVLKKRVVYFPNSDEKLTDIDVSLEGEVYPLTTKYKRKSIFSASPAKGLLEITPNEITIIDSKGKYSGGSR